MITVVEAETVRQLDDAAALRYSAFIDGGPKAGIFNHAAREITPFDLLDRTRNLVAYAGGKPVGTMRIVLPDAKQSACEGTRFNLPMEQSLHFREVPEDARIAEVGRLAIHVDHRGSDVIRLLYKSVHRIMSEHDIRYYAGSSLTGTNRIAEAISYYRTLFGHGFASKDIIAEPRSCSDTDDQHEPALELPLGDTDHEGKAGDMGSLPALIRYYVRTGLLTCGRPFYDPEFDECFLPLVGTPGTLLTVKFSGRTIKE